MSTSNTPADSSTPSAPDMGQPSDLISDLRALFTREMEVVRNQWNRALPFADYIVDRWEKARLLGFGEGSSVYDSALILGNVKVGAHTWIGPFTVLDGSVAWKSEHTALSARGYRYTPTILYSGLSAVGNGDLSAQLFASETAAISAPT